MSDKYEKVNEPKHYQGKDGLTVMQIIRAYECNFAVGNVIKYMLRAGKKPDEDAMDDLKKALWYLQEEIARREPQPQHIGRIVSSNREAAKSSIKGLEEMGRYYGNSSGHPSPALLDPSLGNPI